MFKILLLVMTILVSCANPPSNTKTVENIKYSPTTGPQTLPNGIVNLPITSTINQPTVTPTVQKPQEIKTDKELIITEKFTFNDEITSLYYNNNTDKMHTFTISNEEIVIKINDSQSGITSTADIALQGDWSRDINSVNNLVKNTSALGPVEIAIDKVTNLVSYIKLGKATFYTSRPRAIQKAPVPAIKSTHCVVEGENLKRISLKYNISINDLVVLNNIKNVNGDYPIFPGQTIKLK